MKRIYKYYKERLIEISGKSRSLYSKRISRKSAYDIGKILGDDYTEIEDFVDFLWHKKGRKYPLIHSGAKSRICKNLKAMNKIEAQFVDARTLNKEQKADECQKRSRLIGSEEKKMLMSQVSDLKALKREIEDFTRETGRCELFIGYPFVEGSIGRETIVRAPLLLFPVSIQIEDETTVDIEWKDNDDVQLNKVFILAYAKQFNLNIDDMDTEFANLSGSKLKNIEQVIKYLRGYGFKIGYTPRKGLAAFEKAREPRLGDPIEVRNYAVIGRFPLANAIYNDYTLLEKRKPTEAIKELLVSNSSVKKIKRPNTDIYAIHPLDFAQEDAIDKLNQSGNMVIYGPPGTGKSQTIVNIITDALCKNKRVLVVSQKKAALDVVYNRLGKLNERAMFIVDPEKGKAGFYARTRTAHQDIIGQINSERSAYETQYKAVKASITNEVDILQSISDILFTPTAFGIPLQEMYVRSGQFGKSTTDNMLYKQMLTNPKIMKLKFAELDDAIRMIKEKRKCELFYKRLGLFENNPLIVHIKDDLSVHTINIVCTFILKIISSRPLPFNFAQHPNARQVLAFYLENGISDLDRLHPVIQYIAKAEKKKPQVIAENFARAIVEIKKYVNEYSLLESVLDEKGFSLTLENILNGNHSFLRLLLNALENYVDVRDMNINLKALTETELSVLNFAYEKTKNLKEFKEYVEKLLPARIYHELVIAEEKYKNQLSKILDYESTKDRIISLRSEQNEIVKQICIEMFKKSYVERYQADPENKNFLYQIGKPQNLWPIRKLMEVYGELMLTLFPCWLLSPENVSTIMPLRENLFDLILFDEASQIFIESALPTIYRGRHIAISGDNKQLRPTAMFMRRYMGNDIDELDSDMQAALEVESLLDLATSRYSSNHLNYHYRSKHEEFISFSNHAFYDSRLQIAPNLSKNHSMKPIERIKVNGRWIDRKNIEEAQEVVKLLKKLLKTQKNNDTIGIITFNMEQEQLIEDLIDAECRRDESFLKAFAAESNRRENGEDVSLFIKNIENVQGDERDIIIFSIGYAQNEQGKIIANFGPLNQEGGENRLNVAITRAKNKIYVVTSIEPEELLVDASKNLGPKLFRKYLQYVRAVSGGRHKEASLLLDTFHAHGPSPLDASKGIAADLKAALEKAGWTVEANLGNSSYKLSLAIYDKQLDTYLLGIECDDDAFHSSSSVLERDVYRSKFMESRGWTIIRVWSRDWWNSSSKVVIRINKIAKKQREIILKNKTKSAVKKNTQTALKSPPTPQTNMPKKKDLTK